MFGTCVADSPARRVALQHVGLGGVRLQDLEGEDASNRFPKPGVKEGVDDGVETGVQRVQAYDHGRGRRAHHVVFAREGNTVERTEAEQEHSHQHAERPGRFQLRARRRDLGGRDVTPRGSSLSHGRHEDSGVRWGRRRRRRRRRVQRRRR